MGRGVRVACLVMLSGVEASLGESVGVRRHLPESLFGRTASAISPLRHRARIRYAGCMCELPALPIDRTYRLTDAGIDRTYGNAEQTCKTMESWFLGRGKQSTALETPQSKETKIP